MDVMASTRAVGHPMAWGLAVAWLIAIVGTTLVFSIGWIIERVKASRTTCSEWLIFALKNVYSCFKGLIRPFPEVYFRFKGMLSK